MGEITVSVVGSKNPNWFDTHQIPKNAAYAIPDEAATRLMVMRRQRQEVFQYRLARVTTIVFQACSFNHSASFRLESTALMVHGACVSIGCYAMTDPAMEEIWTLMAAAFRNGRREIQVQLLPFRLSAESLPRHRGDQWYDFWADLKRGSDLFEHTSVPPRVEVRDGRYRFTAANR